MKYSPFRHVDSVFFQHRPIQFTFFVTRRCNARCPFCFYLSRDDETAKSSELTLSEIEKVAASLGDLLWLAFSGGEIFLRPDLVEITKVFYERNRPAIILFPTNGLLTDTIYQSIEEILKECPKSTIVVKLSLDGPARIHDQIRGVDGSFEKTMRTCRQLGVLFDKYSHFDLGINTVFCSINQDYMDETIDLVSGLQMIRTHTISLIRGDVSDQKLKDVDLNKYKAAVKRLENSLKNESAPMYRFFGARLKAAQDILQRKLILRTASRRKQQLPCLAGRLNLVLTEKGDLFPCESFDMKIGNVRDFDGNIMKMMKTNRAADVISEIRKKGCFCTHECYMMTNILFNPACYPALLKEFIQL